MRKASPLAHVVVTIFFKDASHQYVVYHSIILKKINRLNQGENIVTFKNKRLLWIRITVIVLFALTLTCFRLLWLNMYQDTEEKEMTNGELDLRDWDFSDGHSITLTGEWDFHPYTLLKKPTSNNADISPQHTEVPGNWSSALNPDDGSPYGYGSYHLRILVDADNETSFSMRIPSVRSASALYANGLLVGSSGEVGESKEASKAWNVPYSSTSIRADENGVIDIVLQVSNFVDPRPSGLVRSVKFGHEADVTAEKDLSTTLQIITAVVFFVHALFAGLIFLVGFRDKRLLYFSLAVMALMFINVTGGDEKVLYQYITLGYTTIFKLSMFVMILISWSLVHCVGPQIRTFSRKLLPAYTILFIAATIAIVLLPMEYLERSTNFTFGSIFVGAAITTFALLRSWKDLHGGIWIALSVIAIASNYLWWAYMMATGIKVVYYPFDLIIAIICLAGVWFKHYHQMHIDTQNLATKLQKEDKVKDQFLANTSHELRNPLQSVMNIAYSLLEENKHQLPQKDQDNLHLIIQVGEQMRFTLNDLLDSSKLKDNRITLKQEPVSLNALLSAVTDMVKFQKRHQHIDFHLKVPEHFTMLYADRNRIMQILFNLLQNAVKYTPEGTITVTAIKKDHMAHITVRDTGIGIEKKDIPYLFKPYEQFHQHVTAYEGGRGLGLSITSQLVSLHGGQITVKSSPNQGTAFTFTMPLADKKALDEVSATLEPAGVVSEWQEGPPGEANHPEKQQPAILLIDDNPVNLQVLGNLLRNDYQLHTALNGKEALERVYAEHWDLIIADVMMPELSGYELTREIRKQYSIAELPILLLTARAQTTDIYTGFEAGANDYLVKPVSAVELKARVHTLTNLNQSIRGRLKFEAAWLQAQIQPHFLFNTLNTIASVGIVDHDKMIDLLQAFGNYLKNSFASYNTDSVIPINKELSLVHSYLFIEQTRFREKINIEWHIDENLDFELPPLSIQPIIENALRHGILKKPEGGTITIHIYDATGYYQIDIQDDGAGMDENTISLILHGHFDKNTGGIAIGNINRRLIKLYNQELIIKSKIGVGTTVSFRIPKKGPGHADD